MLDNVVAAGIFAGALFCLFMSAVEWFLMRIEGHEDMLRHKSANGNTEVCK